MCSTHNALASLPSLPVPVPQVPKSPYPVGRKPMAPTTPARKAYRQLKLMVSTFKLNKTVKRQETTAVVELSGDKGSALSGQLAPVHTNDTQAQQCTTPAPARVPGGQLAPGHSRNPHAEPHKTTICIDEHHGRAQVAKTSARFLSTLLNCLETLLSTDLTKVHADLSHFIAIALDQTRVPLCVHQYALYLV